METEFNVWAALETPLSDIFQHIVVSQYLTAEDLIRLSCVSRRYHELFRSSRTARLCLANMLKRDASDGKIRDQLPTFGGLSPDEALEQDPWLVARLEKAALKRRRLVLFPQENNLSQEVMGYILSRFRSRRPSEISVTTLRQRQQYDHDGTGVHERNRDGRTEFICLNESGVDLYCHWIDGNGRILDREGDCIRPSAQPRRQSIDERNPPGTFIHDSCIYHSFALCFQRGGPPFAIYQQRRCWNYVALRHAPCRATHAVAVLTGGHVEEISCNKELRRELRVRQRLAFYNLATGTAELSAQETPAVPPERLDGGDPEPLVGRGSTAPRSLISRELAEAFYGTNIPGINDTCWHGRDLQLALSVSGLQNLRQVDRATLTCRIPLYFPALMSEAVWLNNNQLHYPF